jgi:hypothetical protein
MYSYSQIATYLKCGMMYYWRYIEGKIIPPSAVTVQGKIIHRAICEYYKRKIAQESIEETIITDMTADIADIEMRQEINTDDDIKKVKGEIKDTAIKVIKKYLPFSKNILPKEVEKKIEIIIDNISFIGILDYVRNDDVIGEIKTTHKIELDKIHSTNQLTAYDILYRALTKKSPIFNCEIIQLKKEIQINCINTSRTLQQAINFWQIVKKVDEAIKKGIFLPASEEAYYCSSKWCGFWDLCKK